MKTALAALLLASSSCFAAAGPAGTVVRVDIHVAPDPAATATNLPAPRNSTATIVLGTEGFDVRTADALDRYDFSTRKHIHVDLASKARVDYSLFDNVGFRTLELENRNRLAAGLRAAKLVDPVATADNESDLGIAASGSPSLRVESVDDEDRFSGNDGNIVGRIARDGTPVEPRDARMFAMAMRYLMIAPPSVYAALASAPRIPARIMATTSPPFMITTTVVVRSVHSGGVDDAIDVDGYRPRDPASDRDPIDAVLDRSVALAPSAVADAERRMDEETAAAFRDGRAFDAILAWVAGNLTTGANKPFTEPQLAALRADPSVVSYQQAVGVRDKASLPDAIATLTRIRPNARSMGYMVDLAIADDQAMLGHYDVAKKMLVGVLVANRCIASAYKDLGDTLLASWDVPRAWRSWDAGRRIGPRAPIFAPVDAFERSLVERHPEFFDPAR